MGKEVEVHTVKLNDGTSIPAIGAGFGIFTETLKDSVLKALEIGFRHLDTSVAYKTEAAIGDALQEAFSSGLVKREDVYVTTKIPPDHLRVEEILPTMRESLTALKLDYVDLYLVHWPLRMKPGTVFNKATAEDFLPLDLKASWEEMEKLKETGLAKSIGVSNFCVKRLQELLLHAKVVPAVNQIELHPYWQQEKVRAFCEKKGIQVTAWSPMASPGNAHGSTGVMDNPVMKEIALKHDNPVMKEIALKHQKSVAQIALWWEHELGVISLPKSYTEHRMVENIGIWDFSLTYEDREKIKAFDQRSLCSDFRIFSRGGP